MYARAVTDDLDDVAQSLPGVAIEPAGDLGGSDRSSVRRARAVWPDGRMKDVIVKRFDEPESWAREVAALTVLPESAPAPRLLATNLSPPAVVMTDLGEGASVADLLLGRSAEAAAAAVSGWAEAIAAVHSAALGTKDRFDAEMQARVDPGTGPLTSLAGKVEKVITELRAACAPLGIVVSEALADAFRAEIDQLEKPALATLSPGDACPDNNVLVSGRLWLVDFEHAEWRHVAWDAAYLRVPWPTCWCSWRLPSDVTDNAIARYREAMTAHMPYVGTAAFDRDIAAATDLWSVLYSSWFLPLTLAADPIAASGLHSPRRRALLLHRLATTREQSLSSEIAQFAAGLRAALVSRWGEIPLPLAPAFRRSEVARGGAFPAMGQDLMY